MEVSRKTVEEIDWASQQENMKLIEAIFFIAGKFLSMQELMALSGLSSILIKEAISKLKERYSGEDSALEIIERDNLYKMDVKPDYYHIVNKLAGGTQEFTKAEQGTLAIIAAKQPIKQSVVVRIRGNKAYDHIHKFVKLGFLNKKKEGHTNVLTLTENFYDYFNLAVRKNNPLKEADVSDE